MRAVALSIINIFAYWTFAMVKVWHASTSRLLTASTGTLPDMPHTTARRMPPLRRGGMLPHAAMRRQQLVSGR